MIENLDEAILQDGMDRQQNAMHHECQINT